MSKTRKGERNIFDEVGKIDVILPPGVPFKKFKSHIDFGCKVVLHRTENVEPVEPKESMETTPEKLRPIKLLRNPYYSFEKCKPSSTHRHPRAAKEPKRKASKKKPESRSHDDWGDVGLPTILTPPYDSPETKEDSDAWLDRYDVLSQLLFCYLLTRDYRSFSETLNEFENTLQLKHWRNCANFISLMEDDEIIDLLKTVLRHNLSASINNKIISLIIQLLISALQNNDSKIRIKKIMMLSMQHRLQLYNENVELLNPDYDRLYVSLLLADLYADAEKPDISVDILLNHDVVRRILNGSSSNNSYQFDAIGQVVTNVFFSIYKCQIMKLGMKLANVLVRCPRLPPESQKWGSLALGVIVENCEKSVSHLGFLLMSLIDNDVDIPVVLQRASFLKILRHGDEETTKTVFEMLPAYQVVRSGSIPLKEKRKFTVDVRWSQEELRFIISWIKSRISHGSKEKKSIIIRFVLQESKDDESVAEELQSVVEKHAAINRVTKNCKRRLTEAVKNQKGRTVQEKNPELHSLLTSFKC